MKKGQLLRFLPPVLFLAAAVTCFVLDGHNFLGILLCAVAGICVVDELLRRWGRHHQNPAKLCRSLLSFAVIAVIIAAVFTLPGILRGPVSAPDTAGSYLVVLGSQVRGTEPSRILADRIDRAYTYLTEHPDAICIASGGKGDDEHISEAQCIFNGLTARGIDPARIWLEDRSTSTVENFRFTLELIESKTGTRPDSLAVLSNEFHLYRAGLMAADQGVNATFISAPTSCATVRLSYTLREIFALWKYWIIGG